MHSLHHSRSFHLRAGSRGSPRSGTGYMPVQAKINVTRWDKDAKGPPTRQAVLGELRAQGYSCTTYTFPAGLEFGDHSHGCEKKDAILSGEFLFRMGGEEVVLNPGDMLEVPKGKTHYARVVGNSSCEFVDASK